MSLIRDTLERLSPQQRAGAPIEPEKDLSRQVVRAWRGLHVRARRVQASKGSVERGALHTADPPVAAGRIAEGDCMPPGGGAQGWLLGEPYSS
jgi:hypothetical protein